MNLICAMLEAYDETYTRWSIVLKLGLAFTLFGLAFEGQAEDPFYDKLRKIIRENSKLIPLVGSFLPPRETLLEWDADSVCPVHTNMNKMNIYKTKTNLNETKTNQKRT